LRRDAVIIEVGLNEASPRTLNPFVTPFFNPGPIDHPRIPVHVAAVTPAMCRLAGELCDGVRLHGFCTRRYLDEVVMPAIAEGAARAGRSPADLELSGGGFIAAGPADADVARQIETVRTQISFYGSTPTYQGVLRLHGWDELGERLNRLSREGKWAEMVRIVPDDVVYAFAAVGRYDEIVPRLRERFRGIKRLAFPTPAPADEERVQEIVTALRRA